jgi:hypothetical protein
VPWAILRVSGKGDAGSAASVVPPAGCLYSWDEGVLYSKTNTKWCTPPTHTHTHTHTHTPTPTHTHTPTPTHPHPHPHPHTHTHTPTPTHPHPPTHPHTHAGVNSLRGTLPWTAPEIIRSPKAVTEKVGAAGHWASQHSRANCALINALHGSNPDLFGTLKAGLSALCAGTLKAGLSALCAGTLKAGLSALCAGTLKAGSSALCAGTLKAGSSALCAGTSWFCALLTTQRRSHQSLVVHSNPCCLLSDPPWPLQVDVYSFGIVMWELWTGREPFEGLNYHALLHQMTSTEGLRPQIPGGARSWAGGMCRQLLAAAPCVVVL